MSADLPDELLDIEVEEPAGGQTQEPEEERAQTEEPEEVERFVVFKIGETPLAVSVDAVKSIVKLTERTRIPRTSPAIDGVMDLRGEITAIIEPRVHFYVREEPTRPERQRVIVFDRPSDKQGVGIRVDDVVGVELFPMRVIVPDDHVDDEAADHPLVTALIHPEDAPGERIGLLDIKGLIEASGQAVEQVTP
ncbi:chemotaxis protein CheW [Haloarchaeobius sp. DFWS5]|uniref:chemotaxis protein CheW n=1 Tax=Haloarchaeobius sp. DFWS5 TaxID=3446114 RepID=UPI003EBC7F07